MQEQQADGAGGKEYDDKQDNKDGNDLESAGTPLGSGELIKEWLSTFLHNRVWVRRENKAVRPDSITKGVLNSRLPAI